MRALAELLPRLAVKLPSVALGDWPTPIAPVAIDGRTLWVKDEGASNAIYGGNKIRTLEMWFGHARARGARRIWAIGAYGSNHAIATVLHARRAGLEVGAIVFPQPTSEWAVENCGALIASGIPIVRVPSVALMPIAALRIARRERDAIIMPPGGATPVGTLGALSGALELALQIERGDAPPPQRIVVGVGSTCTISGLVAGLSVAHAIGVWRWPVPIVHGVRVTPWPVTAPALIADLAARTLARVERLGGPRVATSRRELLARFVIDGREFGKGYGRVTERGNAATRTFAEAAEAAARLDGVYSAKAADPGVHLAKAAARLDGVSSAKAAEAAARLDGVSSAKAADPGVHLAKAAARLDGVYSAKAAAGLLRLHRSGVGPLLFWASKSRAVLPAPPLEALRASNRLHPALVRWLQG